MKKILQTLSTLFTLLVALSTHAQIIYVAQGAAGNGSSWAAATGNLKSALESATAGTQIWVKTGTYYPASCSDCSFNDRNQFFQIKNGVKLYGGFTGNETSIAQRNIAANPTFLSGDIDQDGTLSNNSFTVVYTHNVSSETLVDGFVITGGNADQAGAGLGTPQTSGGGWFNLGSTSGASSHPTIVNCKFVNNYAWGYGGGMFNDGSFSGACNPTLANCEFTGNVARDAGGGIYNTGSSGGLSSPTLTNCHFIENKSEFANGGAVFNMGQGGVSNPVLTGCTFIRDSAFQEGGAMCNFGLNGSCSPVLEGCIFSENVAEFGGAIYNDGTFAGFSGPELSNCQFTANHSTNDGAAIYNSGYQGTSSPSLMNCLFENNHSGFAGGAMFSNGNEGVSNPVITNCRFRNNHADTYGGALYNFGKGNLADQVPGNASPEITNCLFEKNMALSAGAIYNLGAELGNANALITNCTFFGNHANVGGAVYCNAGEQGTGVSSPTVRNCIFWENTAGEGHVFRIIWGTPTISHSLADVADCDGFYNGMGGSVTCGTGLVFNQNPMFISLATGNFHLSAGSPAIDLGSNQAINQTGISIDLDNLPRIFNSTVDLGVFEFGSMAGSAPVITQNPDDQEVCEGETVTFSVSATGSQPLTFQWTKNGSPIPGETQNTLTIAVVGQADAASYRCEVANATGTVTISEVATLVVNEPAILSVGISASQTEVCEGEEITLTANPVNGGPGATLQWYLNGSPAGSGAGAYSSGPLNDGDTFTCEVFSAGECLLNSSAVSNSLVISVENMLTASLSIVADAGVACAGEPIQFSAVPVNGGSTPSYEWSLNGNIAGADTPSLILAAPQTGDQVQCTMTSSKNCVEMNPVQSNILTVEITPNEVATISISPSVDSTFCMGMEVIFTAAVEYGGADASYLWQVNGQVAGSDDPVFSTTSLADGDVVTCEMTSSLICVEENPVTSNEIIVTVDSCTVSSIGQSAENQYVLVYPNPANGKIFVEFSESTGIFAAHLLNTQGQIALSIFEKHPVIPCIRELNVTDFPQGIYYLQIITDQNLTVEKIVIGR